ncbi:unnamed protein product [Dracunculus medinensis]|uniref:Uncharacterized protein n=1 Tax=Dracunculus medinensis TaxID=318479 RepID=A0A0N4UM34_DRAME|nr:unnamed protein product [Dracunculus medinensis]
MYDIDINAYYRPKEQLESRTSSTRSPSLIGRTETLDVSKLNKLLQIVDKTWIVPRSGITEPVGSNFQYKKTCANIYASRIGACQQIGFGIMCFNYCFEKGEKLQFVCQDASDPAYCRTNSLFDTNLMKHKNDPYKAKAYIHQKGCVKKGMRWLRLAAKGFNGNTLVISRCYATSICNPQTGILNSTMVNENVKKFKRN